MRKKMIFFLLAFTLLNGNFAMEEIEKKENGDDKHYKPSTSENSEKKLDFHDENVKSCLDRLFPNQNSSQNSIPEPKFDKNLFINEEIFDVINGFPSHDSDNVKFVNECLNLETGMHENTIPEPNFDKNSLPNKKISDVNNGFVPHETDRFPKNLHTPQIESDQFQTKRNVEEDQKLGDAYMDNNKVAIARPTVLDSETHLIRQRSHSYEDVDLFEDDPKNANPLLRLRSKAMKLVDGVKEIGKKTFKPLMSVKNAIIQQPKKTFGFFVIVSVAAAYFMFSSSASSLLQSNLGDPSMWKSVKSQSKLMRPVQSRFGESSMWQWFRTVSKFGDSSMWKWFEVPQSKIPGVNLPQSKFGDTAMWQWFRHIPKSSGKWKQILAFSGTLFFTVSMFGKLYATKMVHTIKNVPITPDTELQAPNQNTTTANSTDSEKVGELQNYFKLRFTKLDFGQLVANSLEKFLLFCDQKLQNVYPNHRCINATQGSVIIEFQGDEQYKDAIEKTISEWTTEEILKDELFAVRELSSPNDVIPSMIPNARTPVAEIPLKQETPDTSYTLEVLLATFSFLFVILCTIYCWYKSRYATNSNEQGTDSIHVEGNCDASKTEQKIMCQATQDAKSENGIVKEAQPVRIKTSLLDNTQQKRGSPLILQ